MENLGQLKKNGKSSLVDYIVVVVVVSQIVVMHVVWLSVAGIESKSS